jgi:hypothetical protein
MTEQKLLGDVTAEMLKKVGAEKLAKAYERLTGRPCNCANRRNALNNIHRIVIGQPPVERPGRSIQQVARPPVQQYNPNVPVDEQPPRK